TWGNPWFPPEPPPLGEPLEGWHSRSVLVVVLGRRRGARRGPDARARGDRNRGAPPHRARPARFLQSRSPPAGRPAGPTSTRGDPARPVRDRAWQRCALEPGPEPADAAAASAHAGPRGLRPAARARAAGADAQ